MSEHDLKQLWQSQPAQVGLMSTQQLQLRATRFQRSIRRRNLLEYGAAGLAMAAFCFYFFRFSGPLMRLGGILCVLGLAFVLLQLHRRGSARALPARSAAVSCLAFHRAELARQRDALRSAWLWYVAPIVPGTVMFRWGVETELAHSDQFAHGVVANVFIACVFVAIALFNRRAAKKLQRKIDELDRMATPD
jgi:positive regulator of sigma E activity